MDLETSVFSYFNHLTRLVAREDFIIHCRRESSGSYNIVADIWTVLLHVEEYMSAFSPQNCSLAIGPTGILGCRGEHSVGKVLECGNKFVTLSAENGFLNFLL
jgi:hypothetical protein